MFTRKRQWSTELESAALLFVRLCVDLHRDQPLKDCLYHYKGAALTPSVQSLGKVVDELIRTAYERVEKPSKEKETDINTSDVKFLLAVLKIVLEILRPVTKLEFLYCKTANTALDICVRYKRKKEFTSICDELALHCNRLVDNVQTYLHDQHIQPGTVRAAVYLESPESANYQLFLRARQIEAAVMLEQWDDAMRGVDNYYKLRCITTVPLRTSFLKRFYEAVSDLFWAIGKPQYYSVAQVKLIQLSMLPGKVEPSYDSIRVYASNAILGALCASPATDASTDPENDVTKLSNAGGASSNVMQMLGDRDWDRNQAIQYLLGPLSRMKVDVYVEHLVCLTI